MSIIKELLESRGHKILATKMRNMAAANNQSRPNTQTTHTAVAGAADLTGQVKQSPEDPPFDADKKPKKSAVPGKYGIGPSTARHLAQRGLKSALTKEETEVLDEAEMTRNQLMKKINAGTHEAMSDIKPGKHVEVRHTGTGKRSMVMVKHDPVKEAVEELDEISKNLARRYYRKASNQAMDSIVAKDNPLAFPSTKKDHEKTLNKRIAGMKAAGRRLDNRVPTSEAVEDLDEISKDTLKSYIGKATKDMGERKRQQQIAVDRSNQPRYAGKYAQRSALATADMHADKATSRAKNIGKAAMKFAEESEVEEQITGSHLNVNHNKYYTSQERIRHRKGTLKAAVAEAVTGRSFHDLRAQMAEQAVAPVEYEYYKGRKLHFAKGNRGGKSSSSRGGPASDAGADAGGNGGSGGGNGN